MSEETPAELQTPQMDPLPNRFSRGMLLGCLGIACVLAMPALLFLPLDDWHVPGWLALLVPLAAFGAVALGVWLLVGLPAGTVPARSPWRPLTRAGMPPLVERPAAIGNRVGALATLALVIAGLAAILVIATGAFHRHVLLAAIIAMGVVGCALTVYGLLIGTGRLPPPAWRWIRTPIRGNTRSAAPLVLVGLPTLIWALLVAADAGYRWGYIGLGLIVVGGVLVAPLARRAPGEDQ